MRQFDAFRAITRRENRIEYIAPQICQYAAEFSGSGSSESAVIDMLPVTRRAGPSSILAVHQVFADNILISWPELDDVYTYIVYRATAPEGPWSQISTSFHSPFTDNGSPFSPGSYYYKVTAIEPNAGETLSSPVSDAILII